VIVRNRTVTPSAFRRPRAAAALLGVLFSLATLVAADLWILPRFLPLPRDVWLMGWAVTESALQDVRINAMGFTGDVVSRAKPRGTLRILTLGGSVLFNRRMTERLRAALAPQVTGRLELVGAALRSHTSRSSVLKWRLLAPYAFDVVLIYEGINDLYANHVAPESFRDDYAQLGPWYVRGPLLDRSVIARLVYDNLLHRPTPVAPTASGFRSAESLRANLRELVESVRAHGGVPVLSTFAWVIPPGYTQESFVAGEAGYRNPERYDYCPVELWGPPAWVREGLARHNLAVHEVARETGAKLFDAEQAMGQELRWFGDVCHFSEAGVDVFAQRLTAWLAREGLLRAKGSAE
jgi:lysophospholipase L1-like esterase